MTTTTTTPKRFDAGLTIAERVQHTKAAKLVRYRELAAIVAGGGELTGKQVDELSVILDALRIHHSHFTEDCEVLGKMRAPIFTRTDAEWREIGATRAAATEVKWKEIEAKRAELRALEAEHRQLQWEARHHIAEMQEANNTRYNNPRLFGDAEEYVEKNVGAMTMTSTRSVMRPTSGDPFNR